MGQGAVLLAPRALGVVGCIVGGNLPQQGYYNHELPADPDQQIYEDTEIKV